MSLFPGRFLEELDQIDVNRLIRARTAASYEAVEARRKLLMAGKLQGGDLEPAEAALIVEMDEIEAATFGDEL